MEFSLINQLKRCPSTVCSVLGKISHMELKLHSLSGRRSRANIDKVCSPGGGVLDKGSDRGVRQISPHPVPCSIKMAQKYTLSHKNFARIHCFKRTLKGILPHDTLSHDFPINRSLCPRLLKNKLCHLLFRMGSGTQANQYPVA